jgi:hypothetical protein
MISRQNDYPLCLLGWALFWGVRLGLCFFCHEKALEFEYADPCGGKVFVYFCAFLWLENMRLFKFHIRVLQVP